MLVSNRSRPLASRGNHGARHGTWQNAVSNRSRPLASRGIKQGMPIWGATVVSNRSRPLASRGENLLSDNLRSSMEFPIDRVP